MKRPCFSGPTTPDPQGGSEKKAAPLIKEHNALMDGRHGYEHDGYLLCGCKLARQIQALVISVPTDPRPDQRIERCHAVGCERAVPPGMRLCIHDQYIEEATKSLDLLAGGSLKHSIAARTVIQGVWDAGKKAGMVADYTRIRLALRDMEEYGCACDLMNGYRCGIHELATRVRNAVDIAAKPDPPASPTVDVPPAASSDSTDA